MVPKNVGEAWVSASIFGDFQGQKMPRASVKLILSDYLKVHFMPFKPVEASMDKQGNRLRPVGKTYFFGIGINAYKHWPRLGNAVRDVEAIAELLRTKYGVITKPLLVDQEASYKRIIDGIEEVIKEVRAPDSLIIYYAGHGHLQAENQRGFLVPADAGRGGTAGMVRNSTLRDFFQDAKAQHILFISDACFSGSLLMERRGGSEETILSELAARPSRWVMCSGRHDETVADGPRNGHSPFAQALLDELQHNQKPGLNVAALAQQVQLQCKGIYKNQLTDFGPIYNSGDKRGQLVLWKNGMPSEKEVSRSPTVKAKETGQRNVAESPAKTVDISADEQKGIHRAIAIKTRIINKLQETLAMEDDPIRQIRYEEQLKAAEKERQQLKSKLP
jgi:hypothetical protein